MTSFLASLLVRRRTPIFVAVVLLTIFAATVAARLRFDFTPQALFAGREDLISFSEKVKETFGHSENVVLVVQAALGDDDLLTPKALTWHQALCRQLGQLPFVDRVDGIGTLRLPRFRPLGGLLTGNPVVLIPVVNGGPIDQQESDLVRRKVDGQKLIEGILISRDRRAAAIVLQLDPSRKDIEHVTRVVHEIERAVDEVGSPAGYEAFLGGLPAMRVEIISSLKRDQRTIIPICIVAFALLEAALFRCLAGVAVPAMAIVAGLAWTLAGLVMFDQALTVISNVLPILLMICGVSTCVHFLSAYAEYAHAYPRERARAVREAALHMIPACLLTSLTTALGFLSLLMARSNLLGSLGWQAAMGIGLFFVASVLVCTSTLAWFRPPRHVGRGSAAPSDLARLAWRAGRLAITWPRTVAAVSITLMAVAAFLGSRVVIDSSLLETYDEDHLEVRRMRLIERQLSGFVPLEVILRGSKPMWYLEPDRWLRLREFADRARSRPEVLLVRSLSELFIQADALLPGGEPLEKLTGQQQDELGRRLLRIDGALSGFARDDRFSERNFVAADQQTVRVALRLRDVGARANLRLTAALRTELAEIFPPETGVVTRITGESYVAAVAMDGFIRELLGSLLGVSVLIFLVIGLLLSSLRLGLASIAPNIAPLLVTLGYLVLRGYPLNVGNVIVFAISLGIAVDDTIHFLTRFRQEWLQTRDLDEAIRRTCLGAGRAILMTTILIVCGLAILSLSAFLPTRRFAELAAVTMVTALLGDLLLLPALLKLWWRPATD